jgi:hypothetical protein
MVPPTTCQDENKDCSTWDPVYIWVDPGWAEKTLVVSAFPAFVVSAAIVGGLAGLGMSAVFNLPSVRSCTHFRLVLFRWLAR